MNSKADVNTAGGLAQFARDVGPLRLMLGVLALIGAVFAPSPEMETVRSGWGLITTGVLPAIGPIVFMVLLLDMLMSRVLMIDTDADGHRRYRRALLYDGGLAVIMLVAWLPFLIYLAEG